MSLEKVFEAVFSGVNPRFPSALNGLNDVFSEKLVHGFDLNEIGRSIEGFDSSFTMMTSDNYVWFWSLKFIDAETRKEIVVSFPWATDNQFGDGSPSDRSIAIYCDPIVSDDSLNRLCERLTSLLNQWSSEDNTW